MFDLLSHRITPAGMIKMEEDPVVRLRCWYQRLWTRSLVNTPAHQYMRHFAILPKDFTIVYPNDVLRRRAVAVGTCIPR